MHVVVRECVREIQLPPGTVVSAPLWSFRWTRSAKWSQPDHCPNNSRNCGGSFLRYYIQLNCALYCAVVRAQHSNTLWKKLCTGLNYVASAAVVERHCCSYFVDVSYGRGAMAFAPTDLCRHLDTNRSEFKRHFDKGVSMTAASLRALYFVVSRISDVGAQDANRFVRSLAFVKTLFASVQGTRFREHLKVLSTSATAK